MIKNNNKGIWKCDKCGLDVDFLYAIYPEHEPPYSEGEVKEICRKCIHR